MSRFLRCASFLILTITAHLGLRCERRQPIPAGQPAKGATSPATGDAGNAAGIEAARNLPPPFHTVSAVKVPKPIGWSGARTPLAAQGFRVTLYADGLDYPRWLCAPVLVGWVGGSVAEQLQPEIFVLNQALDALTRLFGIERKHIERSLEAMCMHDWQADPFARGSYSYSATGGLGAQEELARPVLKVLWFSPAKRLTVTGITALFMEPGRRQAGRH